jgi:hypothetical protein
MARGGQARGHHPGSVRRPHPDLHRPDPRLDEGREARPPDARALVRASAALPVSLRRQAARRSRLSAVEQQHRPEDPLHSQCCSGPRRPVEPDHGEHRSTGPGAGAGRDRARPTDCGGGGPTARGGVGHGSGLGSAALADDGDRLRPRRGQRTALASRRPRRSPADPAAQQRPNRNQASRKSGPRRANSDEP